MGRIFFVFHEAPPSDFSQMCLWGSSREPDYFYFDGGLFQKLWRVESLYTYGMPAEFMDGVWLPSEPSKQLGEAEFRLLQKICPRWACWLLTLMPGGVGSSQGPYLGICLLLTTWLYNFALFYVHVRQERLEFICLGRQEKVEGLCAHLCSYWEAVIPAG